MASDAIPESWRPVLEPALAAPEVRRLGGFLVAEEAAGKPVYPPQGCRLKALELTPLDSVKVVILGQDPYHGPGQAMGLSFAVPEGVKVPPSLANIYKELEADLGIACPAHGDLSAWARRGVLLLNNTLTKRIAGLRAGQHCVIESPHPSPLSAYRGFFGSRPFSRANAFLTERGRAPVDWQV